MAQPVNSRVKTGRGRSASDERNIGVGSELADSPRRHDEIRLCGVKPDRPCERNPQRRAITAKSLRAKDGGYGCDQCVS